MFKKMALKKFTSLAIIAIAASIWTGCSSQEDKAKYDTFYGSGSKAREETALTVLQAEKRNAPQPAATAAPAAATSASATDTTKAAPAAEGATATEPAADAKPKRKPVPAEVSALLNKHACLACHNPYEKIIGPPYAEVAKKKYTTDQIVELVHNPKPEHWPGFPPMAPMAHVPKADIVVIATWINSL
jgi:cytochrome c551/c552